MGYVQRKADVAKKEAPVEEQADDRAQTAASGGGNIDISELTTNVKVAGVQANASAGFGSCFPEVSAPDQIEVYGTRSSYVPEPAYLGVTIRPKVRFPGNKVKISGVADGKITDENRQAVADDLTPNDKGRAPRHTYYNPKLVFQHEMVHAKDYESAAGRIIAARKAELGEKHANNKQDVVDALKEMAALVRGDMIEHYAGSGIRTAKAALEGVTDMESYLSRPGEKLAYDDGKPAYQALADGIRKGKSAKRDATETPKRSPTSAGEAEKEH